MPCRAYRKSGFDRCANHMKTCPVCMDPIRIGEDTVKLPCKHVFCDTCINEWLSRPGKDTCPTCRNVIPWQQIRQLTGRNIMPFPGTYFSSQAPLLPSMSAQARYAQINNVLHELVEEIASSNGNSNRPLPQQYPLSSINMIQTTINHLEHLIGVFRAEGEDDNFPMVSP